MPRKYRQTGCLREGCDGEHHALGLCRRHYRAKWQQERRQAERERGDCKVPDCSEPHHAHGYCQRHYMQGHRGVLVSDRSCSNDGCERPHHAKGLCHTCYQRTPEHRERFNAWRRAARLNRADSDPNRRPSTPRKKKTRNAGAVAAAVVSEAELREKKKMEIQRLVAKYWNPDGTKRERPLTDDELQTHYLPRRVDEPLQPHQPHAPWPVGRDAQ